MTLHIRSATEADHGAIWAILEPVVRAGDTYTIDADIGREDALAYWCGPSHSTFVVVDEGRVIGTYYLRRNQAGGGSHVCNCGYITGRGAEGKGVARAMLGHSLDAAKRFGFEAMQFNFVLESNESALRIWKRLGFATIGRIPDAFDHPKAGMVDAFVMHKPLL